MPAHEWRSHLTGRETAAGPAARWRSPSTAAGGGSTCGAVKVRRRRTLGRTAPHTAVLIMRAIEVPQRRVPRRRAQLRAATPVRTVSGMLPGRALRWMVQKSRVARRRCGT